MEELLFSHKIENLEHIAIFGFDGLRPSGLKIFQDHLIYPLGDKISIVNLRTHKQQLLGGHSNTVSALDISRCGKYIASGQLALTGSRATVILWKWLDKLEVCRYQLHQYMVQSLLFSADGKYLISLGAQDDDRLVIWDIEKKAPLCGASAKKEVTGPACLLAAMNNFHNIFLSCGQQHLRIWQIDVSTNNKLKDLDASLGKLRRNFTSMKVKSDDSILYAGTMSGDIVKIKLNCSKEFDKSPVLVGCYGRHNPKKAFGKDCENYLNGIRDLILVCNENKLLIGAGDGTIELVEERDVKIKEYPSPTWPKFKALKRKKVNGCITSLSLYLGHTVFIGTESCEIYSLDYGSFTLRLQITCHNSIVYDIAFPNKFSMAFATASYQSVRVWSLTKKQELLRIVVPNFSAAAVVFSQDGQSILTAWNDGVIRSFTPLTGKLKFAICNAHSNGCSALAISSCDRFLVSGGCEGQIRIWRINAVQQKLISVLKEHTAPIASLQFNRFDREIVSSSSDGTCIIWDVVRLTRKHVLSANTQFTCAQFYPTGVQVLATGTDRKVSYWEVFDGSLVRDIDASDKGCINCLAINSTGETFITGGSDQVLKLWDFQTAVQLCDGIAHAASIVTCKFSPCGKYIVSGSAEGTVIIWKVPEKYWPKPDADPLKVVALENVGKLSKYHRKPEDIKHLEASRSNEDNHIFECPPVQADSNTLKTIKSNNSLRSQTSK